MHHLSKSRLTVLAVIALLPSFLKRPCYRLFFGYKIGKRVRIGLSIVDAKECLIDDDVHIGHLNLIVRTKRIEIKDHVKIGHLNIIRGGDEVYIGRYAEIIRMNEINSMPEPDVVNPIEPRFSLGDGSIITAGHKIDFTDRVTIGRRSILGGRNSSLWTHNRQGRPPRPRRDGPPLHLGRAHLSPGGAQPAAAAPPRDRRADLRRGASAAGCAS